MRISATWIAASLAAIVWLGELEGISAEEPARPAADTRAAADRALGAAIVFLASEQQADGAWRSSHYPPLADGYSLTPLVLRGLRPFANDVRARAAFRGGIGYLTAFGKHARRFDDAAAELTYGVYTASTALEVLADEPGCTRHCRQWADYLRGLQISKFGGWQPDDPEYGGWGYARRQPQKPSLGEARQVLEAPNLSATVFVVAALRKSGVAAVDPAIRDAFGFIRRCQNYRDEADAHDPLDDGGFFFVLGDSVRNKAGVTAAEPDHPVRFRSYTTATADGLRALRLCGLVEHHPRVDAARQWLVESLRRHELLAGYPADRQLQRASAWFYAAWSVSRDLAHLEPEDRQPTAAWLADEIIARQQSDGSWRNAHVELREDDSLVATALALEALSNCREQLPEMLNAKCEMLNDGKHTAALAFVHLAFIISHQYCPVRSRTVAVG